MRLDADSISIFLAAIFLGTVNSSLKLATYCVFKFIDTTRYVLALVSTSDLFSQFFLVLSSRSYSLPSMPHRLLHSP